MLAAYEAVGAGVPSGPADPKTYEDLKTYFDEHWWAHRARWCVALLSDVRHLGKLTTNQLEAHHHGIKRRMDACNMMRRTLHQRAAARLTRVRAGEPVRVFKFLLDDQVVRERAYVDRQIKGFSTAHSELLRAPHDTDPLALFGPRPAPVAEAVRRHASDPSVQRWVCAAAADQRVPPDHRTTVESFQRLDTAYEQRADGWCTCPVAVTRAQFCKHMVAMALLRGEQVKMTHPRLVFDEGLMVRLAPCPHTQLLELLQQAGPESRDAAPLPLDVPRYPLWPAAQQRAQQLGGGAAPAADSPPPPPGVAAAPAAAAPAAADDAAAAAVVPSLPPADADDDDDNDDDDAAPDAPPPADVAPWSGAALLRVLTEQVARGLQWLQDVAVVDPAHSAALIQQFQQFRQLADEAHAAYELPDAGTPGQRLGRVVTGATAMFVPAARRRAVRRAAPAPGGSDAAGGGALGADRAAKRICRGGGCTGCDAPSKWDADEPLVVCATCGRECHVRCVGARAPGWVCGPCAQPAPPAADE
jgi:hypothetical protein